MRWYWRRMHGSRITRHYEVVLAVDKVLVGAWVEVEHVAV